MSNHGESPSLPPALGRFLIGAAGLVVPSAQRPEWRSRWEASFRDWWTLVERGELIFSGPSQIGLYCRDALVEALWLRVSRGGLRDLVRGPGFELASIGALAGCWAFSAADSPELWPWSNWLATSAPARRWPAATRW